MLEAFSPLLYVVAFLGVVILVQFAASTFFAGRDRNQRVNRRLTLLASGIAPAEVYSRLIRRGGSSPKVRTAFLVSLYERVDSFCAQAGLEISPPRLLIITAAGAAILWAVGVFVLSASKAGPLLTNGLVAMVGAIVLSATLVYNFVNGRRNKRLKQIEDQLPLALDVVNRAIRAGHPVTSAMQLAADEMGDPIGTEFGLIVDETTYGAEFRTALTNFARRTGSADAHFFAVSVGIQAETGGNLAEILEGLAAVIRARATLAKRVKALASEGKASATVLSVLPVLMVSFLLVARPAFYTSKFNDPIFWPVAGGVLVLYIIGQLIIARIINFKY
jgi:tight adherence protein B